LRTWRHRWRLRGRIRRLPRSRLPGGRRLRLPERVPQVPPPWRKERRNIAERFRQHAERYFRFLETPGVEPTNNAMERRFRFVVIDRKITQGTRRQTGRRWCERIWTVLTTVAQPAYCSPAAGSAAIANRAAQQIPSPRNIAVTRDRDDCIQPLLSQRIALQPLMYTGQSGPTFRTRLSHRVVPIRVSGPSRSWPPMPAVVR
jgi:hypothetical protein